MQSAPYIPHTTENGDNFLYAEFAIGAAGAVGTVTRAKGFTVTTPIVRNSAGTYQFNLNQGWQALMGISSDFVMASYSANTAGLIPFVVSRTLTGATPNIIVQFVNLATGSAADPVNSSVCQIRFDMKESTV